MRLNKIVSSILPIRGILFSLFFLASVSHANILIKDADVFTMENGKLQKNLSVLVQDSKIKAVGYNLEAPNGDTIIIDAKGLVVTPGLIESASQLGLVEIELSARADDSMAEDFPLGPAFKIATAINPESTLIAVNRNGGVTRALVFPAVGSSPIVGQIALMHLGTGWTPVTHDSVGMLVQYGVWGGVLTGNSRAATMAHLSRAFAQAITFKSRNYRPDQRTYSAQDLLALKSFMRAKKPLVVHVDRASDILAVIKLAQKFKFKKLIIVGGVEAWKVAEQLAEAEVAVILDPLQNIPQNFDSLGARLDNAALLIKAKVKVAFTVADTHNLRRLRFAAGNAVAHGVTREAALAAITRNPAEIWGVGDELGSIVPGKVADLVIWDGDPMEFATSVQKVIINGKVMSLDSRPKRLLERYKTLQRKKPFAYH